MKWSLVTSIRIVLLLFIVAITAEAQQPKKVPRVGILRIGSPPDPLIGDFRDELRKLGYSEGQNIAIEYRYTQGKAGRLRDFAADLVRQKVDVIVAPGGTAARVSKDNQHDTDRNHSGGRTSGRRTRIKPRWTWR